ncbi:hypothetical protein EYZ11_002245 [Aspergillus tanneri]|uniref:FAD-binding domain-containing protein n=1 Tax=Aspergillus tanneri TaxID=1220188 RepID=A0A4S3JR51_9EURO|nr:uncharacterized protein ATNIH1004_001927 [Aspergillus tanneri]KAA8641462.1 hypothetical protein ATNIH1004_001927 [Aspergillus tanneri]THC98243.1 hypothetical protein EYZ11_002245 [Aspergillus tanneri]
MALKILICGGGISGNALAFWLSQRHDVTVIEHFPSLRYSGLQLDLRGPGIEVLRRMGLETAFRACTVHEQGLQLVDSWNRRWAWFAANRSGHGLQNFTTDFEIMRGDLCRLLYDACRDRVRYIFGHRVQHLEQTAHNVTVLFSDGQQDRFDFVVGADGLGSRTRRMMLDADAPDPLRPVGTTAGYFTMARELQPGEQYMASCYLAT